MTSQSLSRAPPGGERRPETGLRGAKRAPKRSQEPSIQFSNRPFLAQSALLRPTCPRRSPEARLGLPRTRNWTPGGSNLTPGASFFDPAGVAFNRLRLTFARRWGHTVPTIISYYANLFLDACSIVFRFLCAARAFCGQFCANMFLHTWPGGMREAIKSADHRSR